MKPNLAQGKTHISVHDENRVAKAIEENVKVGNKILREKTLKRSAVKKTPLKLQINCSQCKNKTREQKGRLF